MLASLTVWLAWWLWPNEERVILSRLSDLAGKVSVRAGESPLARVARASKTVEFFTPDVTMAIEGLDLAVNDRNDLREALLGMRGNVREAQVQFTEIHPTLEPGKLSSVVFLTALANLDGQTNTFARELKMTLKKIDRTWLITRVESVALGQ